MTTATIELASVELHSQGFFAHPEQWSEEMVPELARRDGIDPVYLLRTRRHQQETV